MIKKLISYMLLINIPFVSVHTMGQANPTASHAQLVSASDTATQANSHPEFISGSNKKILKQVQDDRSAYQDNRSLVEKKSDISNGFFITQKSLDFDKHLVSGKCYGRITYPEFSSEDTELFSEINDEVRDFVELYAVCNQGDRDNFSVSYEVPESDSKDYFSVIWLTKKDGKLWRIDTLNFNKETGDLLTVEDIFNNMSGNMVEEIIKLSEGHLSANISWTQIMDKIDTRDIQLYTKQKQWYMVFNSVPGKEKVVEAKLPDYFLQDTEDERAR